MAGNKLLAYIGSESLVASTMSNTRIERPRYTETDVSLIALAEQLYLPIKTVLYLSSEGYIRFFVRTRQNDAMYISVHEDLIAPHGADLSPTVTALGSKPTIGINNLGAEGVIGFFLSQDDCRELLHKGKLRQRLFPSAVKKRFDHLNEVLPNPGFFPSDRAPELRSDGWRVACYPKGAVFDLSMGSGYPTPISLDITSSHTAPHRLYARQDDINSFLDIIDSNLFLHDLLFGEQVIDEKPTYIHVIVEKPAYISEKLTYLIETGERFWHTETTIDPKDYEAKREKVRDALQRPEFCSYFEKKKLAKGVLEVASRFIEPVFARTDVSDDQKQNWPGYLTPELLTLMAAAKLYWSPPHVDLGKVATHPKNEDIETYLRIRGISGNDADYAMTLIRPKEAARGRPVPEPSTRHREWPFHTGS